jgi:transcriptional regulator with XRE-family HTH domain
MKDQETVRRFIELRAQGWSYARIAGELNTAKQTLINWSRKHRFEIQNLRAIELDALQTELRITREAQLRLLAGQLERIESEIARRDLTDVPTARLYSLADALRRQVQRETGPIQFTTPVREIPSDEYCEQAQDWTP